jgi:hypothetical protein
MRLIHSFWILAYCLKTGVQYTIKEKEYEELGLEYEVDLPEAYDQARANNEWFSMLNRVRQHFEGLEANRQFEAILNRR